MEPLSLSATESYRAMGQHTDYESIPHLRISKAVGIRCDAPRDLRHSSARYQTQDSYIPSKYGIDLGIQWSMAEFVFVEGPCRFVEGRS